MSQVLFQASLFIRYMSATSGLPALAPSSIGGDNKGSCMKCLRHLLHSLVLQPPDAMSKGTIALTLAVHMFSS